MSKQSSSSEIEIQLAVQVIENTLKENPDAQALYEENFLDAFTYLPNYIRERYLLRFREVPGFKLRSFLRAVKSYEAKKSPPTEKSPPPPVRISPDGDRPLIIVNDRQLQDVVADSLSALEKFNQVEPTFFERGGELVTLRRNEFGRLFIYALTARDLRLWLSRAADYIRRGARADTNVSPPLEVAEGVLSLGSWSFPALEAIVSLPVVRDDFSILTESGYDSATRLYYDPDPTFVNIQIPKQPTREDVQNALQVIDDLLCDFPFARPCDRANAIAMFLTPLIRPLVGDGCVPLAIIDAPIMGTGKSFLAKLLSVVTLGFETAMVSVPNDNEEWRKTLAGLLLEGQTMIVFDNIEKDLHSQQLASVLTARSWSVRVLGTARHVELLNRATWVVTGNNVSVRGDLARRCYRIRLDPSMEKPWQRNSWKHPDLLSYAKQKRGEIVAALLTLIKYWANNGAKMFTERVLGSFDRWCKIAGGILATAGIEGFLENIDEIYELLSDEAAEWKNFFETWYRLYPESKNKSKAFTTNELCEILGLVRWIGKEIEAGAPSSSEIVKAKELFSALPGDLSAVFQDGKFTGKDRRVGKILGNKIDRVFGSEGYCLRKVIGAGRWRRWQVLVKNPPKNEEEEIPF